MSTILTTFDAWVEDALNKTAKGYMTKVDRDTLDRIMSEATKDNEEGTKDDMVRADAQAVIEAFKRVSDMVNDANKLLKLAVNARLGVGIENFTEDETAQIEAYIVATLATIG
jgi:hypothetical protein